MRARPVWWKACSALVFAIAPASAAPPLDELTLAQRGNAVLAVPIARAEAAPGALDVELPDLESGSDAAIAADNVRALAVLYYGCSRVKVRP
jgi:hypothetical protein